MPPPVLWHSVHLLDSGEVELPEVTTKSVIGITVAICGNVLISLALNFQKLAHKRLDREKALKARERELQTRTNSAADAADSEEEESSQPTTRMADPLPQVNLSASVVVIETAPLLQHSQSEPSPTGYGTSRAHSIKPSKRKVISRLFPSHAREGNTSNLMGVQEVAEPRNATHALLPVDGLANSTVDNELGLQNGNTSNGKEDGELMNEHWNESDYLKSKLWWLGFLLMNIGECGNFISYAFAPASVVAPLGTFALMANCVFAPLLLKERFRKVTFSISPRHIYLSLTPTSSPPFHHSSTSSES
jgi:hypothetical protein